FISRPKLDASARWLAGQEQHATIQLSGERGGAVAARSASAFAAAGLKPRVTEKGGKTFVFGERGAWNRLGAYAVHVALLTIFFGGFLTAQFGRTGQMPLKPGTSASEMEEVVFQIDEKTGDFAPARVKLDLPFEVVCTDIRQKLINKDGPILAGNTLDWLTQIKIKDGRGEREALVHMNRPYDYAGYRFFQMSFRPIGMAREIKVRLTPERGGAPQEVAIARGGAATLADGTKIEFTTFFADYKVGMTDPLQVAESSGYDNPAAQLKVIPAAGGPPLKAFAFAAELPEGLPISQAVGGYKFRLADFEKVPEMHILSVQRDPGANIVYLGFLLLALTLSAVFFFSHQRVWAVIENRGGESPDFEVTLGGNTNRNRLGFEDRFRRLTEGLGGQTVSP
ncbi:MAG: cytochrome c biogenesis protein ResB, partial [Pyrinomonadaceae bacterium]